MLAQRLRPFLVLLALVLGGEAAARAAEAAAPALIDAKVGGSPLWVSATRATAAGDTLDWALLGEEAQRTYEGVRKTRPPLKVASPGEPQQYDLDYSGLLPDCVHYGAAFEDYFNPPSDESLSAVARNAKALLKGEIVELEPGFYRGEPSTLLTVRVDHRGHASSAFAKPSTFYLVYPWAKFSIGSVHLCKQDSRFPYRPAVGDRVLFFPFYDAQDAEGRLLALGPQQLIFERRSGGLVLPGRFRDAGARFRDLTALEKSLSTND